MGSVDICYPWVQPYAQNWDTLNGLEWGKKYLEDFFWRINNIPGQHNSSLLLGCSGVWPGFNDTCNTQWGSNKWMARRSGIVYDSTWIMTKNYNYPLPLQWVYIETFNDFNEGSDLEPSMEYGNQYLDATIQNINQFKGQSDTINIDSNRYHASYRLFKAGNLIETGQRDSIKCYPCYQRAIKSFILKDFLMSMDRLDTIFKNECQYAIGIRDIDISNSIDIYPNPTDKILNIKIRNTEGRGMFYSSLINPEGKVVQKTKFYKSLPIFEYQVDTKGLPDGIYYLTLTDGKSIGQKKVIVNQVQ